jgi:hypothetical protein
MRDITNVYETLVGKPGWNTYGFRWRDNIKMDLKEIGVKICIGSLWLSVWTSGGL